MAEEVKNDEVQNDEEQEKLVSKCKKLQQQAEEHRRKYDWEWLVRSLYVRGYHFARYNRGTNTITFSTRTGVRIPINIVSAHLRGVRNQVTSFQPKWEVLPKVTTESAFENARYSGKVLDDIYVKAQIKRKIKEAITHALMYSVAIWRLEVDKDKNIVIHSEDPYDVYIDPNVKSSNINDPEYGAEYVIIARQVSLDSIKRNSKYKNIDNLQPDNETAAAEYKKFLLQVTTYQSQGHQKENETKLLYQAYLRERDEDGNIKIRNVIYLEDVKKPLYEELLDESEYPIEVLQGDITPGSLYGESWVKHLIPVNRVLDALESHIFEYNHLFAKGRFVIDKNSGVRVIVNQHGQIIEKNRGSQVTPITVPPLPQTPEQQIARVRGYLEDISGVHDVSLGRLPGTIRSGVAIAELRQSDATNQADLVDNLEDFLSRIGRRILKLVAENWNTTKLIASTGLGGKPEYFMAIGERGNVKKKDKFSFGEMKLPLAIIGKENEVRVQVGSWLAYTKEARIEKLKELFRLGIIDQQTYLQHAEFADIDGIVKRTKEEALLQAKRGEPSQAVSTQTGMGLDDESLALAENELMMDGVDQPVDPQDDHDVHITVHKDEAENDFVRAHMNEHINQKKWQLSMRTRQQPQGQEGLSTEGLPTEGLGGQGGAIPTGNGAMTQATPMPNLTNILEGLQ